jgi:hypothetical protein
MLLLCVVFPLWMKESVAAFPVTFVVVLPAAFVFGVFWGRWLARGDDDWLVERLAELFDAVVAHASA